MSAISLDHQEVTETCSHCRAIYPVSRGSLYDGDQLHGLYLAGMHGCHDQRFVVLAIAIKAGDNGGKLAVHLRAWRTPTELQMVFIDPLDSPWAAHTYLGRMLSAAQVRQHAQRAHFIHLAMHVLRENPEVSEYSGT